MLAQEDENNSEPDSDALSHHSAYTDLSHLPDTKSLLFSLRKIDFEWFIEAALIEPDTKEGEHICQERYLKHQ